VEFATELELLIALDCTELTELALLKELELVDELDCELIALELLGIGEGDGDGSESPPHAAKSNDEEKIANAEIFFMEEYL
jgi:hypothetical protein